MSQRKDAGVNDGECGEPAGDVQGRPTHLVEGRVDGGKMERPEKLANVEQRTEARQTQPRPNRYDLGIHNRVTFAGGLGGKSCQGYDYADGEEWNLFCQRAAAPPEGVEQQ